MNLFLLLLLPKKNILPSPVPLNHPPSAGNPALIGLGVISMAITAALPLFPLCCLLMLACRELAADTDFFRNGVSPVESPPPPPSDLSPSAQLWITEWLAVLRKTDLADLDGEVPLAVEWVASKEEHGELPGQFMQTDFRTWLGALLIILRTIQTCFINGF